MCTARVGPLLLDGAPRIAAIIDRELPLEQVAALADRGADLLEIRLDLFAPDFGAAFGYIARIRESVALPLLGTVRPNEHTEPHRLELFQRLLPFVDAIDIELDSDSIEQIVEMGTGKTIVVSEHDFERMPPLERLQSLTTQAVAAGAHIVKIAAMAHSAQDVARLLSFCRRVEHPMVAIAMGQHGLLSRLVAPLFGSLFSYAFVSESVAPGQMGLDELAAEMARYYPDRRSGC
jgi:3-dehydroquinate dehydratase I